MREILLISADARFARMLTLELSALHRKVILCENLTLSYLEETILRANCQLLILDLDIHYTGLEKMLRYAEEHKLPVILFGRPDSEAMTADKLRFYDSDIYRYVFPRPFLMNQFLYCVKELLHFKEDDMAREEKSPAMKLKQHCAADDIRINEDAHLVYYKDDRIALTHTEYALLLCLLRQRGMVLTRAQLYEMVWKPKDAVEKKDSNVVDVYIRYIRAKLDDPYRIKLIETVRGVGYTIRKQ